MPAAIPSRRRAQARRQNSEDIEDVRNTQTNEDPMNDNERSRAEKRVLVKQEKKGKQRARPEDDEEDGADEDDEDEDEDEDDRIDVSTFPNQPLQKSDLLKLKGISDDWKSMKRQIEQSWEMFKSIGVCIAESGGKDFESSEELQKLDIDMREFIDVNAEMIAHSEALEAMHQKIGQNQDVTNAVATYDELLRRRKDVYASKTTRQKYARAPHYIDFRSGVWEIQHTSEPMPPLTSIIPAEDGDESESDSDVEMGGATQDYRCPITLTLLEKPLTSRVCKHSFSADAIKEHCRPAHKAHKCPAVGCNKIFMITDCFPDEALAKKVKAIIRRQQMIAQEDSDAEEVVD